MFELQFGWDKFNVRIAVKADAKLVLILAQVMVLLAQFAHLIRDI
jgi:hypothetical protein